MTPKSRFLTVTLAGTMAAGVLWPCEAVAQHHVHVRAGVAVGAPYLLLQPVLLGLGLGLGMGRLRSVGLSVGLSTVLAALGTTTTRATHGCR